MGLVFSPHPSLPRLQNFDLWRFQGILAMEEGGEKFKTPWCPKKIFSWRVPPIFFMPAFFRKLWLTEDKLTFFNAWWECAGACWACTMVDLRCNMGHFCMLMFYFGVLVGSFDNQIYPLLGKCSLFIHQWRWGGFLPIFNAWCTSNLCCLWYGNPPSIQIVHDHSLWVWKRNCNGNL